MSAVERLTFFIVFVCYCIIVSAKRHSNDRPRAQMVNLQDSVGKGWSGRKYKPDWEDLDSRPLPEWYDRAKVGIFLHWGVFSVPSYKTEWFWANWKSDNKEVTSFMSKNYPPNFSYQEFAPMFTAEFFEPNQWADIFKSSGAQYVVLTSKHHEGFTLFPSKRSFGWNSVDIGPKRDLVKDLSVAVRKVGMKFGVYHSLYEWYNPIYQEDKNSNFSTNNFVFTKLWPDVKQLVEDYQPSVIWSDGDWEAHDTYWHSTDLIAWLYNESPNREEIVVNDRWGVETGCKHGDFYNCADRYNPQQLQPHKWENAFTLDKESWGFRRNMNLSDVYSAKELLRELVTTVSCGGNVLINVGPSKDGVIPVIFEERLRTLGQWLKINGEAIYGSSPWFKQNETVIYNNVIVSDVWYTCIREGFDPIHPTRIPNSPDEVERFYAIFFNWPENNKLRVKNVTTYLHSQVFNVKMLGASNDNLMWSISNGETEIQLPNKSSVASENGWVLKFVRK